MHNRIGFNRLSRKSSHRKALHKNMVTSLFKHERIKTTKAKAKEIRKTAEKIVTRAKVDSVHNRRIVGKLISDKQILNKLFTEISPRFQERPGGYTRILKLGYRQGDAAEMVILELVEDEMKSAKKKSPKKKAVTAKAKKDAKETPKAKEDVKAEEESKAKEEPKAKDEVKAEEKMEVKEEIEGKSSEEKADQTQTGNSQVESDDKKED